MMSNMLKTLTAALFGLLLLPCAYSQTAVPTLIYPIHGAVFLPQTISFEWNITSGAVAYHLQVSDNLSFGTVAYNNSSILTASQIVPCLPNNKDLYWRACAFDGVDSTSWSAVYSFYLLDPHTLGNMQLWVRADSGTVGGASVSQWQDYSGNGVQVTRFTKTKRPLEPAVEILLQRRPREPSMSSSSPSPSSASDPASALDATPTGPANENSSHKRWRSEELLSVQK